MEGTRHERVIVLITAYIIGFITAYIAFGVIKVQEFDYSSFTNQSSAVITSQKQDDQHHEVFVAEDAEGLVVIKNNKRTLISVKNNGDLPPEEGTYISVVYKISPDQEKIYFCEQPLEESDTCRPYIYSIEDNITYPVTINGERVAFSINDHSVEWSEEGELLIGE